MGKIYIQQDKVEMVKSILNMGEKQPRNKILFLSLQTSAHCTKMTSVMFLDEFWQWNKSGQLWHLHIRHRQQEVS